MAAFVVLSWICAVLAVLGNLLVLISYWRDRSLREMHIYIIYLAVCDFTMGLIIIPLHASDMQWIFGLTFCKIFYVLENFLEDMATFLVILLCMDRLALLKLGAHYSTVETSRRARFKIFICLCASVLLNGPWLLPLQGRKDVCETAFVFNLPLEITLFVLDFLVPFFSITFVNICIYLAIRKRLMIVRPSNYPLSYKRQLNTTTVTMSHVKEEKTGSEVLVDSSPRHIEASHNKNFLTACSSLLKVYPESASSSNIERPSSTTTAPDSKTESSTHEQTTQKCQGEEKISPVPQTSIYESLESMPTGSGRPVSIQEPPLLNVASESEMTTEAEKLRRPSQGKIMQTKSISKDSLNTLRRQYVLPYLRFRKMSHQEKREQREQREQRHILHLKKKQAAHILIAIELVLVVFWVPYRLTKLIKAACDECMSDDTFRIIECVSWLRPCVNPMLYAANCPAFKTNFAQILEPLFYCLGVRFCFK